MALGPMCHLMCWLLSCGLCYFAMLADRWQVILGEFPGRCTQCAHSAHAVPTQCNNLAIMWIILMFACLDSCHGSIVFLRGGVGGNVIMGLLPRRCGDIVTRRQVLGGGGGGGGLYLVVPLFWPSLKIKFLQ